MTANWSHQTIWTGDCLDILRGMNSESVDLVYLDPPFNSKANYAAPIGSKAAGAAFKDTWTLDDVDVEWINLIEAKCQRSFNFPQVWSSKIPPPLVESNNDNYACGRSWAGRLRPVQVAVGARQRVHGDGSVHGLASLMFPPLSA